MNQYGETAYVLARIMLWTCSLVGLVFPFLYHWRTRGTWSFTPIGRHIMQFRAVFALMLLFTALSVFLPPEVTITASIVLYSAALYLLTQQIRYVVEPQTMDPEDLLDADPDASPISSRLLVMQENQMKSRPVVITMSILAGLQFLFGGLTAMNLPTVNGDFNSLILTVGAFGTLAVAAAQTGIQFYVQSLVTPHEDVAAFRNTAGQIVAGPAAPPEGEKVDVVDEDTGRMH